MVGAGKSKYRAFEREWEQGTTPTLQMLNRPRSTVLNWVQKRSLTPPSLRILNLFLTYFQITINSEEEERIVKLLHDREYKPTHYSSIPLYLYYFFNLSGIHYISPAAFKKYHRQKGLKGYGVQMELQVARIIENFLKHPRAISGETVQDQMLNEFTNICEDPRLAFEDSERHDIKEIIARGKWTTYPHSELGRLLFYFLFLVGRPAALIEFHSIMKIRYSMLSDNPSMILANIAAVKGEAWMRTHLPNIPCGKARRKWLEQEVLKSVGLLGDVYATSLAEQMGLSITYAGIFLNKLKDAGLLQVKQVGLFKFYKARGDLSTKVSQDSSPPEKFSPELRPNSLNPALLRSLTHQQQIFLLTILKLSRTSGKDYLEFNLVTGAYEDVCNEFGIIPNCLLPLEKYLKTQRTLLSALSLIKIWIGNNQCFVKLSQKVQTPHLEHFLVQELISGSK